MQYILQKRVKTRFFTKITEMEFFPKKKTKFSLTKTFVTFKMILGHRERSH
jgi:hypothetical protein